MSVIDPCYRNSFAPIDRVVLIASLPNEPYIDDHKYYKFVAKIYPLLSI